MSDQTPPGPGWPPPPPPASPPMAAPPTAPPPTSAWGVPPAGAPTFGAPTLGTSPFGPSPVPPAPKRSSLGLILGIVAAVVVLGLVAVLALVLLGRDGGSTSSAQEPVFTPTSDPLAAPTTEPSNDPTTAPVDVPPGFKLVTGDGFSYLMPTTWNTTELTPEKLDAAIDAARDKNPELAAMLEQFRNYEAMGGLSLAVGPPGSGSAGVTAPALNLLAVPGVVTLDQMASSIELGLGAVDGKVISKRSLKVGGKDALRVEVEARVNGTAARESLLFVQGTEKVYVLTVAGTDGDTAMTILESLRVP